jgi:aspartate racemase
MEDAGIGGPTIGLLAGMGVSSTAPFLEMVIAECQRQYGARHQSDYPQMIIFSWPTPFRFDRPMNYEALALRIVEGLRRLSGTGVDFIAIPANTPHMFWDQLVSASDVPLLNMIDIAVREIPDHAGPVALLGTRPTRDSGLYHRPLEARGLRVIATDAMQEGIDAILPALWGGDDPKSIRERWEAVIEMAMAEGAKCGLLACTDLNAIPRWREVGLPLHDATGALAAAVVAKWCELAATRVSPSSK